MFVSELERFLGIKVYGTSSEGVGGTIRQRVEDFVVEEILVDGSRARVHHFDGEVLSSSPDKNRYLICVLVKRHWNMFLVLRAIAWQMGVDPRRMQIAGIKDTRAVTAQHITIEGASAEEIRRVHVKDVKAHPIGYIHNELSSYYLFGNGFRIVVRSMSHSKSNIRKRVKETVRELRELGGIPNFFGHQRFGTIRPITHLVGKAMIQGDLKKALMLFLARPSPHEHPESRQARKQLQKTQDFRQAQRDFPKALRYERWMLKHLSSRPKDFVGAFRRLPINLRILFPQAYQSYLFNEFLSERIKKGLPLDGAVPGDYVVNVETSGLPMYKMRRIVNSGAVTEVNEEIRAGKTRLAIPIVGFRQLPFKGVQGEIEKQILEEEDISFEDFKVECFPEISLRGSLRAVTTPLNNFLLREISEDHINPSRHKAEASFMLHRGSYATILLRELMKPCNVIEAGF